MKLQVKPGVGERDESSSPLADKEDPAEKERPPPGLGLLGPSSPDLLPEDSVTIEPFARFPYERRNPRFRSRCTLVC